MVSSDLNESQPRIREESPRETRRSDEAPAELARRWLELGREIKRWMVGAGAGLVLFLCSRTLGGHEEGFRGAHHWRAGQLVAAGFYIH